MRACTRVALSILILLSLGWTFEARGESWSKATVITVSGWIHEDVTVETTPGSPMIKLIHVSGGHRLIPVGDVRVIRDSNGSDITKMVLAGLPASPVEPVTPMSAPSTATQADSLKPGQPPPAAGSNPALVKPPEAPVTRKPTAKRAHPIYGGRFRFGLGGGVGHGFPSGTWFDGLESGLALGLQARAIVADNLYLGVVFTRQSLGVSSEWDDNQGTHVDWDAHLNEIYFVGGVISSPRKLMSPVFYLEGGLGSVAHKFSATASTGGESVAAGAVLNESQLGLLAGTGVIIPVVPSLGVELETDLRLTGKEDSDGTLFGIRAGLIAMLGR